MKNIIKTEEGYKTIYIPIDKIECVEVESFDEHVNLITVTIITSQKRCEILMTKDEINELILKINGVSGC